MNRLLIFTLLFVFQFSVTIAVEAGGSDLKKRSDRISYSLGHQIGVDFRKQETDIDPDAFLTGVLDALADASPRIDEQELHTILLEMKKKIQVRQQAESVKTRENAQQANREYLAENAQQEGVVTLPSGLQYKIIDAGTGRSPGLIDKVKINYRGTLIDGTEIGSNYGNDRNQTFRVNEVVPGMTEALQLMKEGAKWRLFLSPELGFGKRGALEGRTIIYDVELLAVLADQKKSDANGGQK